MLTINEDHAQCIPVAPAAIHNYYYYNDQINYNYFSCISEENPGPCYFTPKIEYTL